MEDLKLDVNESFSWRNQLPDETAGALALRKTPGVWKFIVDTSIMVHTTFIQMYKQGVNLQCLAAQCTRNCGISGIMKWRVLFLLVLIKASVAMFLFPIWPKCSLLRC